MQTQNTRAIVVTAVVAVCIAVLMSAYFTRSKKQTIGNIPERNMGKMRDMAANNMRPNAPSTSPKSTGNNKSKKGSWANTMLPFYSIGIIAYIMFIVAKIMSKKYYNVKKSSQFKLTWSGQRHSKKGNAKTKITMHELRQLEEKLQQTEEAMQEIFSKACYAMNAAQNMIAREESSAEETFISSEEETNDNTQYDSLHKPPACKRRLVSHGGNNAGELQMSVRKVKRVKRKARNSSTSIKTPATTSDSDCEHLLQSKRSRRLRFGSQEEDDSTLYHKDRIEALNSLVSGTDAKSEKELLKTTKGIRKSMTELQSYLEEKKAQLLEE